jgi:hypothetical protein
MNRGQPQTVKLLHREVDMSWNFRMVDATEKNSNGEVFPFIRLAEVYYHDNGTPMGYTWVDQFYAEDVEGMRQTLTWMTQALDKPVLKHGDFSFDIEKA